MSTKNETPEDPIRPNYYKVGTPWELIPFLKAWGFDKDAYIFQTIVYLFRAGRKHPEELIQDYKKAEYYLRLRIADLEELAATASKNLYS